jgi:hypothetical protein
MLLKRIYDPTDLQRYQTELAAAIASKTETLQASGMPDDLIARWAKEAAERDVVPSAVSGYELVHTGVTRDQHFSTSFVTELLSKGLATVSATHLTLNVQPEPLVYELLRRPGRYCLVCSQKLENDEKGELARLHVAENHPGTEGPGYEAINYFDCVLNEDQHAQYALGGV